MNREFPAYEIKEFFKRKHKYCVGIPLLNEGESMKENNISDIADIIIFDGGSNDNSIDINFLKSVNVRTLLMKKIFFIMFMKFCILQNIE